MWFIHHCEWLIVGFICISLMMSEVEYLFIYLLVNDMSSLEKHLFYSSSLLFLNWVIWGFLLLSCCSSSSIFNINSLDMWFANIFFHSVGCLFMFLMVSFKAQTFNVDKVQIVFSFSCAFGIIAKNPLPNPESWRFMLMFSS